MSDGGTKNVLFKCRIIDSEKYFKQQSTCRWKFYVIMNVADSQNWPN